MINLMLEKPNMCACMVSVEPVNQMLVFSTFFRALFWHIFSLYFSSGCTAVCRDFGKSQIMTIVMTMAVINVCVSFTKAT